MGGKDEVGDTVVGDAEIGGEDEVGDTVVGDEVGVKEGRDNENDVTPLAISFASSELFGNSSTAATDATAMASTARQMIM